MKFQLDLKIPEPPVKISHRESLLLIGSCFSSNIGKLLEAHFFSTSNNPTGILFDPLSICRHLEFISEGKVFEAGELFEHNELFHSWDFHSEFSGMEIHHTLKRINEAIGKARTHLSKSKWLLITLGSAFIYELLPDRKPVANCHKFPLGNFSKRLLGTEEIKENLEKCLNNLKTKYPEIRFIFTISPVRHIRDGIVENNRSKARLTEAVHRICEETADTCYFPSYELLIDVLRDYRFYDTDLVHPSQQAAEYIFDRFCDTWLDDVSKSSLPVLKQLHRSLQHRTLHPGTKAEKAFKEQLQKKKQEISGIMPWIDFGPTGSGQI